MVGRARFVAVVVAGALSAIGLGSTLASSAPAVAASLEPVGPGLITAGTSHTCAVSAAGAATCWGSGTYGRLGTSLSEDSAEPAPVFEWQAGVQAIEAGQELTCGVIDDGVKCWGYGTELGRGTTRDYGVPVSVLGLEDGVTGLSVGYSSSCAIKGGAVFCWGDGDRGVVGNGSTDDELAPIEVAGLPAEITSVSVGHEHSCALSGDATVWCWGSNVAGQLGDGTTTDSFAPIEVTGLPDDVRDIATAYRHTCATTWDGQALCWGHNADGQLGNGSTTASTTPVPVADVGADLVTVEASGSSTCAIDADDQLWCWGANESGQLGNYTTADATSPVEIEGMPSVARVAVGPGHTCAIATTGELSCWGSNTAGKLGRPTPPSSEVQGVHGLDSGVTDIDGGNAHTCAVASGAAKCWGDNASGQLGIVGPNVSGAPRTVTGLSSGVTDISAGTSFSCAVVDGAATCWGLNANGQLGDGTTTASATPVAVTGLGSGVTAISAGTSHACAIKGGDVWCWGLGSGGQLGTGTTASSTVPVAVALPAGEATEVAADATTSCAIRAGAVSCWGTGGGTGRGAPTNPDPALVTNMGTGSTSIATGSLHSCGVTSSGGARCWGSGTSWQLGQSINGIVTTPVTPIGQQAGITRVSAAGNKSCAVKSGGVVCWGNSPLIVSQGQPTAVAGLSSDVTEVTVGASHQCAIRDAAASCWGTNAKGELGNGLYGPSAGLAVDPPTILDQPRSVAAVAGSTASFTAVASGSPAPSIRWERSDDGGATWQAVADATTATLSFTAQLTDHGARFRAQFENDLGSITSDAASLTVGGALPSAPGAPTARPGDGEAVVSWTAPTDDGGAPITGYVVTPYIGLEAQTPTTFTGPATSQTVTGLADGMLHRFVVSAVNAAGSGPGSSASNEVWVHPGLPQARVRDVRVLEDAGVAEVEVELSKPAALTARVRTSARTATAADFTPIDEAIEFTADGPLVATVAVPITDDTVKEVTETFATALSVPSSKALLVDGTGSVSVVDEDGLPAQVSIEDVSSAAEGSDAVFRVTIRGTVDADVVVPYATSASTATSDDFTATSGSLSFSAGEVDPVRTFTVPITDDGTPEGPESLVASITGATGLTMADSAARAWIPANDGKGGALPPAPRVRIDDLRATEGGPPESVVVRIDQSADASVVVGTAGGTATAGADVTPSTTTVAFVAGGPTAIEVPVSLVDDTEREAEERFTVTLASPSGASIADPAATVTVLDDDGLPPQLQISDAVGREGGHATFLVSLAGSLDREVSIDLALLEGTATAGADFGGLESTRITFPAGSSNPVQVVRIAIEADQVSEPGTERFTLKGVAAPGATITIADGTATASISD